MSEVEMVAMAKNQDKPAPDVAGQDQSEVHRRQRSRNLAVAGILVGLAVLFYFVAIVRMSGS
ncbi:MAG TPA: hypothetical protein DCS82_09815 [Rhodospirillaceae bacterium]|nr:hypothetical protein [Rhodospirillaceae bacterium]